MKYVASCAVLAVVVLFAGSNALAANSVQGWMVGDGVTGQPGSPDHRWDREIVWLAPVGSTQATAAGMRMIAQEPGWFLMNPPTGFPGGDYALMSLNVGSIDGGSVGFTYRMPVSIPAGPGAVENLQLRTGGHYTVMYNRNFTEWAPAPWVWGSNFYQTFVAVSNSVTRVAVKLADKDDHVGTGYRSMTLNYAIVETNGGAPSTWTPVSPVRTRFLAGTMDPIIHVLDVNFLSHECQLVIGREYALRIWIAPGSQATGMAVVARPQQNNNGYPQGHLYNGDSPQANWDLYGHISGGAPDTVTNFGPTNQDNPGTSLTLGWQNKYGQTFRATGDGLAAVELMYTVGCDPNNPMNVGIALHDGVGGPMIGKFKTTRSVTDLCQQRVAAFWEPGEAPLIPGNDYFIEFDASTSGGFNAWAMTNDIPNARAYIGGAGGAPTGGADLTMQIVEYSTEGFETPTPDPNATATFTPTSTPTATATPTPIQGENLLLNGNMEQGIPGTSGQIPTHWTNWTGAGSPVHWHVAEAGRSGLGARMIGGSINGHTFDAAIFQQVSGLIPGRRYGLIGYCLTSTGHTGAYSSWIGYDLTGQTVNGSATSVQYVDIGSVAGAWQATPVMEFTATGPSVSVWLRARNTSVADIFYADFDDIYLLDMGEDPDATRAILMTY